MSNHIDSLSNIISRTSVWIPIAIVLALLVALTGAWDYVEPVAGILTMGAAVVAVAQTRKARVSVRRSASAGPLTIVNFTGHPLAASEGGWADGAVMINLGVQLRLNSFEDLRNSVLEAIMSIPEDVRARLLAADPNVVVIPPPLAAGSQIMDPLLHGLVGEFVRTSWSCRLPDGGFVWMKPVDRQALRLDARHRLRINAGPRGDNNS